MSCLPAPAELTFGTSATLPMSLTLDELSQLATAEDEDWSEDIFDEDDEIGGASPLSDWSSAPSSPVGQPIGDREASEREIDGTLSDAFEPRGSKGLLAFKVPEPAVPVLPTHHQASGGTSPMVGSSTATTPMTSAAVAAAALHGKPASFVAQRVGQAAALPGPFPAPAPAGTAMGVMPMGGAIGGPMFNPWAFQCYNPMAFAAAAAAAANAVQTTAGTASTLPTTATAAGSVAVATGVERPAAKKTKRDLEAAVVDDDIESGAGGAALSVGATANAADVAAAEGSAVATPADATTAAAHQIRKRQKAEDQADRRRRNREAADRSRIKRRALLAKLPQEKRELEEKVAQMEKELAATKAENRSLIEQNTFLRSLLIKQQPGVAGMEGSGWGGKVPATSEELGGGAATACADPNASPAGMMLMAVACLLTVTHLTAFFDTDGQTTFLNSSTEAMSHGVSTGRVLLSYDEEERGVLSRGLGGWASGHLFHALQILLLVVCLGDFVPKGVRVGVAQLGPAVSLASSGVASLPLWAGSKAAHVD
mmetsp:Transcript_122/g.291  ORF Transcript_122/g.291 Transcript_122/m.291 type:complete len:540 (-) Transcript_122:376-1995(-)|eukprot:CAMPEP_0182543724 /NCGR_PEP_ID=MMETSP1323-20130603/32066_1 /TAXON_ID=236787 /ORGANISM="Florenciella parvula, Strain RCC1693" /LENGTH=539 /DNA_ID=CAMNT_0024754687 /DNA_START=54 /DNA_END=1673 /DNA_ORIENTATION=+